jgi:hypothetical protein
MMTKLRFSTCFFCFFLLFSMGLALTTTADPWDPMDDTFSTATNLGTPTPQEQVHAPHTLSPADTEDWFVFTLYQGTEYEFFSSGLTDTVATLFASDGESYILVNDDGGQNLNFKINFTPTETGIYYLLVFQYSVEVESAYALHYINRSEAVEEKDPWDPMDDSPDTATNLNRPTTELKSHGPHSLNSSDQQDWFSFILTAGEIYVFSSISGADTVADLYFQSDRIRVAHNDNSQSGPDFELIYIPQTTGVYLLRVKMFEPNDHAIYTLEYQLSTTPPPSGDAWDPGDDIYEGATEIATLSDTASAHGPHSLSGYDKVDWFRLNLESGYEYTFFSQSTLPLVGAIYGPDGQSLLIMDEGSNQGNFNLIFSPYQDSRFYLAVFSYENDEGTYTLYSQISGTPPMPVLDPWDPVDDTPATATPLNPLSDLPQSHGMHSLSPHDHYDWFSCILNKDTEYLFWTSGSADTIAQVYSNEGTQQVLEQDDGGIGYNFRFVFKPETDGTYYLRVRLYDIGALGEYMLHYQINPVIPDGQDEWDPMDDTPLTATNLGMPGTMAQIHGIHTLTESDTEDWFQFNLEANTIYEFTTTGDSDTVGTLYFSDGLTEYLSDDTGGSGRNFRFLFTPYISETYYLKVTEFSGKHAAYFLSYRGEPVTNVMRWMMY